MYLRHACSRARLALAVAAFGAVSVVSSCAENAADEEATDIVRATASPSEPARASSDAPLTTVPTTAASTPSVATTTTSVVSTAAASSTVRPTSLPTAVPAYASDEVYAVLAPPALAWANLPSGPAYDQLAASARTLLESGRALPAVPGTSADQFSDTLTLLSVYPGSDDQVIALLARLGPAAPVVTLPPAPTVPTTVPIINQAVDVPMDAGTDPLFGTCREAKENGYGPYVAGETEYGWYDDRDNDGIVCE